MYFIEEEIIAQLCRIRDFSRGIYSTAGKTHLHVGRRGGHSPTPPSMAAPGGFHNLRRLLCPLSAPLTQCLLLLGSPSWLLHCLLGWRPWVTLSFSPKCLEQLENHPFQRCPGALPSCITQVPGLSALSPARSKCVLPLRESRAKSDNQKDDGDRHTIQLAPAQVAPCCPSP